MIRSFLLAFFAIFYFIQAFGQTNTDFKYNVGIKAFSYGQTPSILNDDLKTNDRRTLTGLLLKFNDNQLAYRVGVDWFNKNPYSLSGNDGSKLSGKYTEYGVYLGFEHDLSLSRFKPYFGTEIEFFHSDLSGSRRAPASPLESHLTTLKNGLAINPFIGFKYTFIRRLYVSVEAAVRFDYSFNRVENTGPAFVSPTVSHYSKGEFLTSPVSLVGLHYNFGIAN